MATSIRLARKAAKKPAKKAAKVALGADQVVLAKGEFESVCEQLAELELETIGIWARRHDEVDGLERILVPIHAARRNLETAVELETESAEVQP